MKNISMVVSNITIPTINIHQFLPLTTLEVVSARLSASGAGVAGPAGSVMTPFAW